MTTNGSGRSNGVGRRTFLRGALAAGIGSAALALPAADALASPSSSPPVTQTTTTGNWAFEGEHQAGITTPLQEHSAFVSLDVTAADRGALTELLQTITDKVRFLTTGGEPPSVGISAPPADSGILGPTVPVDGLTVTASVGASLFDDRYGLAAARPAELTQMPVFPNDDIQPAISHGDLLLQICAHERDVVVHALREITRATRGGMQIRWRQDGFASKPRPSGTPRNLLGFRDGTANPAVADAKKMSSLVWVDPSAGEPAWTAGGSYHVVRLIRMLVEFWDRISLHEQENIIGRRRDSGAPLTGTTELDDPQYELDPTGDVIQLDAHIRLANPRTTPDIAASQMLRRPYNYDAGTDLNGQLDMGLIFVCFNQDIERQFAAVQTRLADEPMVDYVSPRGGGYFFALPGVHGASDYLGRTMLA
jgi:deferrochelatase/peroxidase EfeB